MKTKISRILGVGVTLSLLVSLLVALPAAAVSVPLLTIPTAGDNVINTVNADYNVYFNLNKELGNTDTISITFPTGYTIGAAPTVAIAASDGWIGGAWLPAVVGTITWAGAGQTITGTLAAADQIGEMSNVRVSITTGVTNPSATGDYAVAVATSQETTPVSSNTVSLVPPTIPPLPGVVTGYNSAGETLVQTNSATAIVTCLTTAGVVRVTLSDGTYTENPTIGTGQTVVSVSGAATAIIKGTVTLNAATAVLDSVTVNTGGVVGAVAGGSVRNCILSGNPALNVAASTTSTGNTIAAGAGALNGIQVNGGTATSTGDTINVAATGTGINVLGGALTLSGATVTGASGTGLTVAAAVTATVTGSTFSNLNSAINSTAGGTVNISTSTIDGCGLAGAAPQGAVQINGGVVIATANTITNGPNAIARVTAAGTGAGSSFKFNTFTGNVASFANGGAGTLDATNNWWGSSAGPTVASTGLVLTNPWLIAQLSNPTVAVSAGGTLVASAATSQAVSGVTVAITLGAGATTGMNLIATGNYDGNPVTAEPPADTVKSFDVYIQGPALDMTNDTATVTFFGITGPTAQVWAYSDLMGTYVLCSNQRVDMFNGSVVVTVTGTAAGLTIPNLGNMSGLEFVLTQPSAPVLGPAPLLSSLTPLYGSDDVATTPILFTWGAVAGATSYQFEIAEDIGAPFSILTDSRTVTTNQHVSMDTLKYDTTYRWRVKGIMGSASTAWTESLFTTEAEPEEPVDPVWIIEQEPTQIEWPDNITINVPPIETPEIPEYILWVVVAVGAILVIAVVVLIVRTRRVA